MCVICSTSSAVARLQVGHLCDASILVLMLHLAIGDTWNLEAPLGEEGWYDSMYVSFSSSLPEFMDFKLFGKIILVVNIKFGLFLGHPLSK